MTTQSNFVPAAVGAVAGAIALAIIGFSWGGWVTKSSATTAANKTAETAVVDALAPICVNQFQHAPDMAMKQAEFAKLASSDKATYVQKSGWATMPGSDAADMKVATACSVLIGNLKV